MALPTIYFDTGGDAANSGSSDQNAADWSGAGATSSSTTITLDGTPDLTALATDGSQTIALAGATNSNQKIFKITGKDIGAFQVTVDIAPTGVGGTPSAWKIGGRMVYTPANWEGAAAPGWTFQFNNSPASRSGGSFLTARAAGDSANGFVTVRGKAGVRPALTITDTNQVITGSSVNFWWIENLELAQQGASGLLVNGVTNGWVFRNVKASDAGGNGLIGAGGVRIIGCEISGMGGSGVATSSGQIVRIEGSYIHDNAANGVNFSSASPTMVLEGNIIESNAGRGILLDGATTVATFMAIVAGNTVYGNGSSGLEVADADMPTHLVNNIFQDNGDGAGEFNVEWVAGSAEMVGYHGHNIFYHQGGGGGANLSGLTVNATELTSDPLFVDAANGDFRLRHGSPARGAGFPGQFLGGPRGYLDIGAAQAKLETHIVNARATAHLRR